MSGTDTGIEQKSRWQDISRQIEDLWRAGQNDEALLLCREANRTFGGRPGILAKLAQAYLKTGQYLLADQALSAAHESGLPTERFLELRSRLLWQSDDMPGFAQCAEELRRQPGRDTTGLLKQLATAYMRLEAWDKAERIADALIARSPTPKAIHLKIEASLHRNDPCEWERTLSARLFDNASPAMLVEGVAMLQSYVSGRSETLLNLVRQARDKWPDDPRVIELCKQTGIAPGPQDAAAPAPPAPGQEKPEAQIARMLQKVRETRLGSRMIPAIVEEIRKQVPVSNLQRPLITDDPTKDVIVSPRSPGGTLAVVFTGLRDYVSLPLETLDAYLSAAGITAVYLRDFNRLLFCNGVQSWGADFDSTLTALRRLMVQLGGFENVFTIGISAGGTGAINFALSLPAARAVCFGTPTTIVQPFLDEVKDRRARLVLARLNRLASPHMLDPRPRIKAQSAPVKMDLIFGKNNALDRAHAEQLRDFPGVSLFGIAESSLHISMANVIMQGELLNVLTGNTKPLAALSGKTASA